MFNDGDENVFWVVLLEAQRDRVGVVGVALVVLMTLKLVHIVGNLLEQKY